MVRHRGRTADSFIIKLGGVADQVQKVLESIRQSLKRLPRRALIKEFASLDRLAQHMVAKENLRADSL